MATTNVRWVTGQQYVGVDSTRHSVVLSTTEEGVGMKPSEMLLVALSACTAVDVVSIMQKKRQPLSFLEIVASGEHDDKPPHPFRKIHLLYRISGKDLTEKAISQAIQLSEEKYCSVAATVRGVAEISTDYEILPC
jgi:putative redox protein